MKKFCEFRHLGGELFIDSFFGILLYLHTEAASAQEDLLGMLTGEGALGVYHIIRILEVFFT